MKIAFLNMGIIENDHRVRRNVQWMTKQGHDVMLFQAPIQMSDGRYDSDKWPPTDGCPVVCVSGQGLDVIHTIIEHHHIPDVVIVEELDALTMLCGGFGSEARRRLNNENINLIDAGIKAVRRPYKVVYAPHEFEASRPWFGDFQRQKSVSEKRDEVEALLATVVDGAVAPCDPITEHVRSLGVENAETVTNAPYRMPENWEPKPYLLRDTLCIDEEHIVVHCGNVSHSRAVPPIVEAVRLLDDVAMVFVGEGSKFLGDSYIDYAKRHGVHFVPPMPYPHNGNTDLYDWLSGGTVGIIGGEPRWKNHRYQLPNKFFEMGFSGLPILFPSFAEVIGKKMVEANHPGGAYGFDDDTPTTFEVHDAIADWLATATSAAQVFGELHEKEHFEAKNGPAWNRVLERL